MGEVQSLTVSIPFFISPNPIGVTLNAGQVIAAAWNESTVAVLKSR